jgi:hypothetical protein
MFWSEDRVQTWFDQIFKDPKTEVCYNLMCLALSVHKYWEKGYFALKPISLSDDKKRLEIQFFWLTKRNRGDTTILQRPILSGEPKKGPNMTILMNCDTEKAICSGDQISLRTNVLGENRHVIVTPLGICHSGGIESSGRILGDSTGFLFFTNCNFPLR